MAEFSVTLAQLATQAKRLEELNGNFNTAINNLKGTEEDMNSMWEGSTRSAFHNAFLDDYNQMVLFYNTIVDYVNAIDTIANQYQTAEEQTYEVAKNRSY